MNEALIPRKVLFGNLDKVSPKLSPDGKSISDLAPLNGVLNVWIEPAYDPVSTEAEIFPKEKNKYNRSCIR
jgi:hypothetical protein